MSKFYFRKDDMDCYTIDAHLAFMEEHNIYEMAVFEAKRITGSGYFFCKYYFETGTSGESCGKFWCPRYKPNNGKSGRCKHYGYIYERTDKIRILKLT